MDEREKRIKDSSGKAVDQERRSFSPSRESKLEPVDSKVLIERDFTPQTTNLINNGALQLPQDGGERSRQDRQGSFLTDKDPSFIQPNEATYSDIGETTQMVQQQQQPARDKQSGQVPIAPAPATDKDMHIMNQLSRSKTVSFAIVKEFSFGGTTQQNAAMLEKNKIHVSGGGQQSIGLDLDQNSLQDDRSKKSPSNVDLLSQVEGTSMKTDYKRIMGGYFQLFQNNSITQAAANSLPFHTLRCHVIYLLSKGRAANTIEFMKKYLTDFYDSCRPSVKSAILSIQFIAYLKSKEHL